MTNNHRILRIGSIGAGLSTLMLILMAFIPFIGAVFAACGLWSAKRLDQVTAIIGTLMVVVAAIGLYLPGLSILANLWFLCWFACISLLTMAAINRDPTKSIIRKKVHNAWI